MLNWNLLEKKIVSFRLTSLAGYGSPHQGVKNYLTQCELDNSKDIDAVQETYNIIIYTLNIIIDYWKGIFNKATKHVGYLNQYIYIT